MSSLVDSVILAATLAGSFGAAFLAQKAVLDLFMRIMNRR